MKELLDELRQCLQEAGSRSAKAKRIAAAIRSRGGYRWVGLYDVTATTIDVVAWDGPNAPTYPRFPVSQGLNGAAVSSRAPVIVQDVRGDPRYLTTIAGTRAEMIMPVKMPDGRVLGTIDVESDHANAFATADALLMQECARVLLPLWEKAVNEGGSA